LRDAGQHLPAIHEGGGQTQRFAPIAQVVARGHAGRQRGMFADGGEQFDDRGGVQGQGGNLPGRQGGRLAGLGGFRHQG
ncbi:hypothetical protein RZS08_28455, partial [Arthrospira platensis SPKY1]|nr:hypothetical protein [Arthrospira platensis SPKY1]